MLPACTISPRPIASPGHIALTARQQANRTPAEAAAGVLRGLSALLQAVALLTLSGAYRIMFIVLAVVYAPQ